jgi:hypothetical protein
MSDNFKLFECALIAAAIANEVFSPARDNADFA